MAAFPCSIGRTGKSGRPLWNARGVCPVHMQKKRRRWRVASLTPPFSNGSRGLRRSRAGRRRNGGPLVRVTGSGASAVQAIGHAPEQNFAEREIVMKCESGNQIDRIIKLTERGWKGYEGQVDANVYERVECPAPIFSKWLFQGKPPSKMTCVGCDKYCLVQGDNGFTPPPSAIVGRERWLGRFTLTPREMVQKLSLLNVSQAAYCLNMSERRVYALIAEGRLWRIREAPVRVRAGDVARMMEDFDE